jgi:hypothetical protein
MTGDRTLQLFPQKRESGAQVDFYRDFFADDYPQHGVVTNLFISLKNIEQSLLSLP